MAIDPFEELLLRANPNPERKGCPGSQALREIAESAVPFDDPRLQHVRQCSPCFGEFRVFRDSNRDRQRRHQLTLWSSVLALFVLCVSGVWIIGYRPFSYHPGESVHDTPQGSVHSGHAARLIPLDFRTITNDRGEDARKITRSWEVPATLVKLQIRLPFGSDDGEYRIELRRNNDETLKKASGSAIIKDGDTILTVDNLDLSDVPPGTYALFFAHADASWHHAPLVVK